MDSVIKLPHRLLRSRPVMRSRRVNRCLLAVVSGIVSVTAFLSVAPETKHFAVAHAASVLESRFDRALPGDKPVTGIVILGGSSVPRAEATLMLARRYPEAVIVGSGPSAVEQAVLLPELRSRLIIDTRPRATFENAFFSKDVARPKPGERWIIVTSAVHMPRAVGAFRAVGFDVEAWPVDDTPRHLPHLTEMVGHEMVGLAWYWLRGRSASLFPGRAS